MLKQNSELHKIKINIFLKGRLKNIKQDWISQIFVMRLVLRKDLNTTVKKIADFIHKEEHLKIGFIKNISAHVISIVGISTLIFTSFIYYPYLF